MSNQPQTCQVFIAAPAGLEAELAQIRDAFEEFNRSPRARELRMSPVWATGRMTQSAVAGQDDLRRADRFILILRDRWRTRHWGNSGPDSPDCEAAYELATELVGQPDSRLRSVSAMFKEIDPGAKQTPGFQLNQVLSFRKYVEHDKPHDFVVFGDGASLRAAILKRLYAWADEHAEFSSVADRTSVRSALKSEAGDLNIIGDDLAAPRVRPKTELVREAIRLADSGRLAGAEACFGLAIARADDLAAFVEYGKFLKRVGRLAAAQTMLETALKHAKAAKDGNVLAAALANLGLVLQARGDLIGAVRMQRRCLELSRKRGHAKGIASATANLGLLAKSKGDLPKAELLFRRALQLERRLRRPGGVAQQYCNLGLISRRLGDLTRAEDLLTKALEIDEGLGRLEAVATNYGNIGLILHARGRLEDAEQAVRKALSINEGLGRLEGMANDYGNMGLIALARGDLDGAERCHLTSLAIEEQLGRTEGIAKSNHSLGMVERARARTAQARERLSKAAELFRQLGMKPDADRSERALAAIDAEGVASESNR